MANYENDRAFEAVLQNTGQNIELFVDEFFGFLARRSDFFVVTPQEGGRIGFPPGVAAKLIISKFKKWEEFHKGQKDLPPPVAAEMKDIPGVASVVEVPTSVSTGPSKLPAPTKPNESRKTVQSKEPAKKERAASNPVQLSDTWNGRKTDKYSWSQSIKELDIHIVVGADVKTKKHIKVDIQMNKIRVVTLNASGEETVTDWHLAHPIVKDESYWSLHPGESIFLSLQKVRELWWDHLFEGEECIDRTKIEAVRPMDDLDDEEQAKIQELVFNQEQKLKGLPTTEELKMEEVMKKAWDAEGSPFKGQPFDMSRIQLASNTIGGVDQPPPS